MNIIEITNKFPTELDAVEHFEKIHFQLQQRLIFTIPDCH